MLVAVPKKPIASTFLVVITLCKIPTSENMTKPKYRACTVAIRPNASGIKIRVNTKLLINRKACATMLVPNIREAARRIDLFKLRLLSVPCEFEFTMVWVG
jgi:hypothetical protein